MTPLKPGSIIRIRSSTFKRQPLKALEHLRGKTGRVVRAAHRHRGVVLWECEVAGVTVLVWEGEMKGQI